MITIRYNDITKKISLPNGKSLAEALIEAGFFVDTVCGGKGICGKCAVRVTDGIAPISASDADFFTQDELRGGMRLACTLRSVDDITVEPAHCDEASFDIVGSFSSVTAPCQSDAPAEYALAIDIGTTTIAMCIADCASGKIRHSVAQLNHQRQFGADVISRIQAAIGGKGKLLREIIRSDLQSGISALCKESGINVSQISKTAISANTAMTHLLMGYDCRGLSAYPFRRTAPTL